MIYMRMKEKLENLEIEKNEEEDKRQLRKTRKRKLHCSKCEYDICSECKIFNKEEEA